MLWHMTEVSDILAMVLPPTSTCHNMNHFYPACDDSHSPEPLHISRWSGLPDFFRALVKSLRRSNLPRQVWASYQQTWQPVRPHLQPKTNRLRFALTGFSWSSLFLFFCGGSRTERKCCLKWKRLGRNQTMRQNLKYSNHNNWKDILGTSTLMKASSKHPYQITNELQNRLSHWAFALQPKFLAKPTAHGNGTRVALLSLANGRIPIVLEAQSPVQSTLEASK